MGPMANHLESLPAGKPGLLGTLVLPALWVLLVAQAYRVAVLSPSPAARTLLARDLTLNRHPAAVHLEHLVNEHPTLGVCYNGTAVLPHIPNAVCHPVECLWVERLGASIGLNATALRRQAGPPGHVGNGTALLRACPSPRGGQLPVPAGQRPIVSFILTFRDHAQLAAQCLLELFRTASEVASAEFVVIDDGSTEDTSPMEQAVSRLEGLFGIDIQYLRHTKALGYGPSNDEGIRLSCGQYVVLVNSDTLVTRGWLSALLLAFKENARAGIVGPLFMGEKDKVTEAGALIYHAKGDLPVNHNVHCGQNLSFFDSSVRRVDYISAACIMLPRSLYLKVGGFDHQFTQGYWEDVDLTLRIRQAGYDIIYQPFAVVYHEPGTTFAPSWSKRRIVRRNQKRFARKWRHLIKAQLCPWMHNVEVAGNREAYLHIMWMDMELPASQGRLRQLRTLLAAGHAVTVMHRIAGPRASQAAALLRLLGVVVIPGRPASKWELGGNAGCKFDLVLVGSAKMPRAVEQLVAKHCPKAPRMELHSDHLTGPALMQALRLPDLTALPQELRGTCRAKLPDQYKGLQRPSTA